jgi:ATP-dependent Clp protease ATP-binding subunit ClpC
MTSNLGVKKLQDFGVGVGFNTSSRMSGDEDLKKALLQKELKNHFTPEFLNRLDEVIVFNPLKETEVRQIVDIELSKLNKRLDKLGYNIEITTTLRDMLADIGFDEKYGARPIKRAIQEKIEDFISEEVLRGKIKIGNFYTLEVEEENVVLKEGN